MFALVTHLFFFLPPKLLLNKEERFLAGRPYDLSQSIMSCPFKQDTYISKYLIPPYLNREVALTQPQTHIFPKSVLESRISRDL